MERNIFHRSTNPQKLFIIIAIKSPNNIPDLIECDQEHLKSIPIILFFADTSPSGVWNWYHYFTLGMVRYITLEITGWIVD